MILHISRTAVFGVLFFTGAALAAATVPAQANAAYQYGIGGGICGTDDYLRYCGGLGYYGNDNGRSGVVGTATVGYPRNSGYASRQYRSQPYYHTPTNYRRGYSVQYPQDIHVVKGPTVRYSRPDRFFSDWRLANAQWCAATGDCY